ncbi:signal peptidase I W [Oxobacter pfennigii]|uniref:Signal peptidase I n=1 Tax=Oxobacter pfennigii TaxID=36849 RepID=A0A0P8WB42_9CLOT|nr:signal peptidase I [Oxobacter pfennigii]KPU45150.1 signal peptidase I W [Oxobacter pfennigii]
MPKKIKKWAANLLSLLLLTVIFLSLFQIISNIKNPGRIPKVFGFGFLAILSDSMHPAIHAGDMIISRETKASNIKIGDIITYNVDNDIYVTHRVADVIDYNNAPLFLTKGDANNAFDGEFVQPERLEGVMMLRIPFGGYIANFIRSGAGFFIFIVLPAIFLFLGKDEGVSSWSGSEELNRSADAGNKE